MGVDVNEVINNICDKLGILASELVPEMGKMKIAESECIIIITFIMLIIAVIVFAIGMKKHKECRTDDTADTLMFISGIAIVIGIIVLLKVVPDFVGWLVSPKAKTFAYVLSKLGGFQ